MTEKRHIPFAKRLRYALETVAVYIVYGFFRILPLSAASATGGWIGRSLGKLLPSSKTAYENLARVMPETTLAERDRIVGEMWDNLGRIAAEYPHLGHIMNNVEIIGGEYLQAVQQSGQPSILFAAHIANWEICSIAVRTSGVSIYPVYRRPNNPWVESLLANARGSGAVSLIAKGADGAREMLAVLKRGETLGIMMDQKLNEGMAIPFFGVDAMTAPAIAAFALKFKCPVHPVRIERLQGCRFRVTVLPALAAPTATDKTEAMREILTEVNRQFEEWIRARPGQWLWIHRRWGKFN